MPSKKDQMKARGRARNVSDLEALLNQTAAWESGTDDLATPVEPTDLAIEHIAPDHIQPRRAMPETLRAHWCEGAPIEGILTQWRHDAERTLARHELPIDPVIWLGLGQEGVIPDEVEKKPLSPATRQWIALLALAGSILAVGGLEQPVTVYADGDGYRLQVGERRLLAFHLLAHLGYEGYTHIPAVVRAGYDPIRQAVENGARLNLNAVSLARQIAVLIKAVHKTPLQPGGGQAPQSWYAEALDLEVTSDQAEAIATVVGLTSRRMFYNYRKLLTLPPPVWNWADQFDWAEGKIRGLMRKAGGQSEQLITLAQEEVNRELGSGEPQRPLSLTEKAVRRAERGYKAMLRAADMSDEEVEALPSVEREKLVEAAKNVLRRFH